jgi:glycosyltransferase involved in cell wall biosynthesis
MTCEISVVMPVLNGDFKHLRESINSILNQTFQNFEFIIIDDGSDSKTKAFLKEYSMKDPRIKLITNSKNIGVGKSLNAGVNYAHGKYIARHDADDNAKVDRLEVQHKFMEKNTDLVLSCTSVNHIDMEGNFISSFPVSTDSNLIAAELLLNSRLCHPTLMIKTEELLNIGGYPDSKSAQDYLLYLNLLEHNFKFGGIDRTLVDYRINTQSITRKNRSKQLMNAEKGAYKHCCRIVGELNEQSFSRFWYFIALKGNTEITITDLFKLNPLLKLVKENQYFRDAWFGEFKWISRAALNHKVTPARLVIAIYFRYLF